MKNKKRKHETRAGHECWCKPVVWSYEKRVIEAMEKWEKKNARKA